MRKLDISTRWGIPLGVALIWVCIAGCGGRGDYPKIGTVSGTVTVEGNPAPNVAVQFSPVDGGRTSVGVTDGSGRYSLTYIAGTSGAQVGKHQIRLAPSSEAPSDNQLDLSAPQDVIPAKYQGRTFEFDVKAGDNTFDINLK